MFQKGFLWLAVVAGVAAAARTVENTCPPGLLNTADRNYLQVRGGSCFHFVLNKQKTYPVANRDCMKDGGTLVLPKTQSLNDFLADQLLNNYNKSDEAWIGLHDQKKEGAFVWEDGSELAWSNFAQGKGTDNNWLDMDEDDCVALDPKNGGFWHDHMCERDFLSWFEKSNHNRDYICQYKLDDDDENLPYDMKGKTQDLTKQALPRTVENTCPHALRKSVHAIYLHVREDSCFQFVLKNPKTYKDANKDCKKYGGTLAMPKTQSLNNFLADKLFRSLDEIDDAWIGLHDLIEESKFVWEDGSELGWSNFARGQGPETSILARGVEDCVAMNPEEGGKWHDFQCDHNLLSWLTRPNPNKSYICQYKPDYGR